MERLRKIFFSLTLPERFVGGAATGVAAVSAVLLFGITLAERTTVVPAEGGEYTEGFVGQPTYVNPVLAQNEIDKQLVRLTFANLAALAEKIEPDEHGRIWSVRLREELRWSDSRKLTSDDVLFTVAKLQDPETQSPAFAGWQGVVASRVSELELQFTLVGTYPLFHRNLEDLYVLPKHLFADTPPPNWRLSEYNLKPVGSGPYVFDSYEIQSNGFISDYRLQTNPAYFGKPPFIERILFRFFPNHEELVQAFNTAEIDGFADLLPEPFAEVRRPHQLWAFPLPNYYAVFLNQGQNLALKEAEVRRALSLALDRTGLIREVFGGHGESALGPLPGRAEASEPDLPGAEALLEETGWKRGENGFREKRVRDAKVPLRLEVVLPQVGFLVRTAESLKTQWGAIGVELIPATLPLEEVANRVIRNRAYQALLFGNVLRPPDDLYAFWHSNERFYPGLNLALYQNKKADELLEAIRLEPDETVRRAKLEEVANLIREEVPAVFLYSPQYLFASRKDLQGVSPAALDEPSDRLLGTPHWFLKTGRAFKSE